MIDKQTVTKQNGCRFGRGIVTGQIQRSRKQNQSQNLSESVLVSLMQFQVILDPKGRNAHGIHVAQQLLYFSVRQKGMIDHFLRRWTDDLTFGAHDLSASGEHFQLLLQMPSKDRLRKRHGANEAGLGKRRIRI